MRGKYLVYCLIDPKTNQVRYIGKSSYGLYRPKTHLRPSVYMNSTPPVYAWIRDLAKDGLSPIIEVLEECDTEAQCYAAETHYMRAFGCEGEPLLNILRNFTYKAPRVAFTSERKQQSRLASKRKKSVVNLTTGEKFLSTREAAEAYGCDHRGICRACNKEYKTYKNQLWSWA